MYTHDGIRHADELCFLETPTTMQHARTRASDRSSMKMYKMTGIFELTKEAWYLEPYHCWLEQYVGRNCACDERCQTQSTLYHDMFIDREYERSLIVPSISSIKLHPVAWCQLDRALKSAMLVIPINFLYILTGVYTRRVR
jgi:hypothetical protein